MLNALIANIQDAVVLLDENGNVIFESPAAARILGMDPNQVLRAFGMSRIHPEDRPAVVDSFERTRAVPGYVFRASYRFQRADGEWRHLEALAENLLEDRDLGGILITFRDVTDRTIAVQAAERATAARDEFLSRMSHELRTPLSAIIGWARLLQQEDSVEVREAAEQIVSGGLHLLQLITDALDLAAVQEGRVTMQLRPILLGSVVNEAVDLVRPLAALRNITLDVGHGSASDSIVEADDQRLRQVLLNLLSNAVKYGRSGGRVAVSWAGSERGCRLQVADDGPGIPEGMSGRLFERYERLGAGTSGIDGAGLGLAITRRLVELMGGSIDVASVPDRGTSFRVDLRTPKAEGAGSH